MLVLVREGLPHLLVLRHELLLRGVDVAKLRGDPIAFSDGFVQLRSQTVHELLRFLFLRRQVVLVLFVQGPCKVFLLSHQLLVRSFALVELRHEPVALCNDCLELHPQAVQQQVLLLPFRRRVRHVCLRR